MRNKVGMKFDCIFEETLDFIDIDYTHLNKTVRYENRLHGEWIEKYCELFRYYCSICGRGADIKGKFCQNCGASMIPSNSEIEKSKSEICPCIECCKIDNSEPCRKGCSEYQKWKEGEHKC